MLVTTSVPTKLRNLCVCKSNGPAPHRLSHPSPDPAELAKASSTCERCSAIARERPVVWPPMQLATGQRNDVPAVFSGLVTALVVPPAYVSNSIQNVSTVSGYWFGNGRSHSGI